MPRTRGAARSELAYDASPIGYFGILVRLDPRQNTVANGCRLGLFKCPSCRLRDHEDPGARARGFFIPLRGFGDELTVLVSRHDFNGGDRRQLASLVDGTAGALELAVVLEVLEKALERNPFGSPNAESTRDLALADFSRTVLDEIDELVGRRQASES